jgi:hypothetical protein
MLIVSSTTCVARRKEQMRCREETVERGIKDSYVLETQRQRTRIRLIRRT